jgi:hypothetical protein
MAMHTFTISLGSVDFSKLETDADFRREAQRFLPDVLIQVGEKAGEVAWNGLQKSFRAIPGVKVNSSSNDKSRFIREAGQSFRRKASSQERRKIEDAIIRQLQAQKSRNKTGA